MTSQATNRARVLPFRGAHLTYKVVRSCLVVTLTRAAGKRWGVYLAPGYDGPTHHDYRLAHRPDRSPLARTPPITLKGPMTMNILRTIRIALAERFPSHISPIGSREMARRAKLTEVAPNVYRSGGPDGPVIELLRR